MRKNSIIATALAVAATAALAAPVLHAGKAGSKAAPKAATAGMKCPYMSKMAGGADKMPGHMGMAAGGQKAATGDSCCAGMAGAHGTAGKAKVSGTPPPGCPMFGAKATPAKAKQAQAGKPGRVTARSSR